MMHISFEATDPSFFYSFKIAGGIHRKPSTFDAECPKHRGNMYCVTAMRTFPHSRSAVQILCMREAAFPGAVTRS